MIKKIKRLTQYILPHSRFFLAGCDIPFNLEFNLLNRSALLAPNKAGSGKAPYPTGTHVTMLLHFTVSLADDANQKELIFTAF